MIVYFGSSDIITIPKCSSDQIIVDIISSKNEICVEDTCKEIRGYICCTCCNKPIKNATVSLISGRLSYTTKTNHKGKFCFIVPSTLSCFDLEVFKNGYRNLFVYNLNYKSSSYFISLTSVKIK